MPAVSSPGGSAAAGGGAAGGADEDEHAAGKIERAASRMDRVLVPTGGPRLDRTLANASLAALHRRELGGYRTRDVMIGRGGETRVVVPLRDAMWKSDRRYFAAAFVGFGPVHVQPWISQPLAPFFTTNVICDAARIATPFSVKVYVAGTIT